ncbi:MAG: CAP domain-containing protein [Chloroflexi bacterium]|nr:CAP domain-containing protein [Chloroflexota bacterium]
MFGSLLFLLVGVTAVLYAQTNTPTLTSSIHLLSGETSLPAAAAAQTPQTVTSDNPLYLPLITKPNTLQPFEQEVLDLVNQERANAGCNPVTANEKLVAAARGHSDDMAVNDFFSHTGSDGSSPWERIARQGYSLGNGGENIAAGHSTPANVMNAWMNSSGHRANILNCAFTEIGIGYAYLANDTGAINYRHYWTQDFGTPR